MTLFFVPIIILPLLKLKDAMADGPDGPVRQGNKNENKPPPRKLSGDGYDAPEMTTTAEKSNVGEVDRINAGNDVSVEVVVDDSPL